MSKRIVHELTDDDLLRLVQGVSKDIVLETVSEAAKFIYASKIKHGDQKITAQLVYYTYKEYKGWGNKRQSRASFFRDFNKYFEPKRDKNGMYYLLDEKSFDLSQQTYWIMQAEKRAQKKKK